MNITEISIKRPSLIIVLFSVFTLLGFIGYKNLSYELMPDFNQPVIVIKTVYPGAEPNEVETSVSRKIEDALSNLEGVDYLVTNLSKKDISAVKVEDLIPVAAILDNVILIMYFI